MCQLRWPLSLLLLGSCHQGESAKYASAAVTAGIGVAAAAVNRAATDECWGTCSPGFGCDEKSGKCVLLDELPPQPRPPIDEDEDEDDDCIVEDDGRPLCPDDPVPPQTSDVDARRGGGGGGGGGEGGGDERGEGGAQNVMP